MFQLNGIFQLIINKVITKLSTVTRYLNLIQIDTQCIKIAATKTK